MATQIVCLDGTNQAKIQTHPTNIAYLFDALGGVPQDAGNGSFETQAGTILGKYLPGVGSAGSRTLRVLGNLFGDGIAELIIRGYTYLSRVHTQGDGIVIVGFSRGATAARALAGIVVTRGLLDPAGYDPADKEAAYQRAIAAWYGYREGKPDLANQARLYLFEKLFGQLPKLQAADFTEPKDVAAVGVFDTVSSLGLPHLDSDGDATFDFSICDSALSPRVARGFHALAADEMRDLFTPTLWQERDGVVQQIFPGAHSNIGGGYPERGLSDCTLAWMIEQLNGVVPAFDTARIGGFKPLATDAARDESLVFPFFATPRRARAFPKVAQPSAVLTARLGKSCDVLPGTNAPSYAPRGRYADGSAIL